MKIMYSKNVFIRQYGRYTLIYNQLSKCDETYLDADVFCKFITHQPRDLQEVESDVLKSYANTDKDTILADLKDFIEHLKATGVVIVGEDGENLGSKDKCFTYNDPAPYTAPDLRNYNIEASSSEIEGHKDLHAYFEKHPTPYKLHIDLTSQCNEKCVHCYVPRGRYFYINAEKTCAVLKELREMEGMHVTLSGGECLLHPEFEKIIRCAHELGLSISVLSNLTLLDNSKAELLKEMDLSLVQVSLYSMNAVVHDAITQLPGSFEKTKAAIELLHDLDVPVQISCPCMKSNYRDYAAVLEYAYSMKMKAYTDFIMMARSDGSTDNLTNRLDVRETREIIETILSHDRELKASLQDFPKNPVTSEMRAEQPMCGIGIDSICLNADGNYYPCSGFQGYPLGNYNEQTLKDMWENSPRLKYLRGLRRKDIPQCIQCKDSPYCSMCLVRNFNETGDMLKVSKHFCKVAAMNREIVDERRKQMSMTAGCGNKEAK